ncbi:hypothetical protein [Amycolatopsis cihanbeyliensis]|uniref:Uncharacterized protein n=1 Tax=Amycolatopsis cihanbeyliensis TaxID=1128664 RepID=A0A542DPQ3_AMYCI|nr:hypothetical protein [Amycolatopsis cihanbeyliensis]TQJ05079.1 hypothetical protein FB471_4902 [Amycolatopsis cihanbeyliensis]
MTKPSGGYHYTPEALSGIAGHLREAASLLDGATGGQPPVADAGASSSLVARAMQQLVQVGVVVASVADGSAEKVHVAQGSYDDIENNHAGQLKLNEQRDTPERRRQDGVHG